MELDFSHCRSVWVPDDSEAGGFWSPPPPHVQYGVAQIVAHPFFLLADDMGGMKTAQAIIAAQFLHEAGTIDRVIVVAPASVRPKVWFDEDLGQLREQVWDDKRNIVSEYHQRVKQWSHGPKDARPLKWIVTNYEFIRKYHLATLLPYCGPKTLLILDESSAVRTWDSAQTQACMLLRWKMNKNGRPVLGAPRCGRVLMLNGTPVAESPLDMFSQGNLLHPSILECKYITHYKARYAVQGPVLGYGGRPLLDKWNKPILKTESWANLEDLQRRFAPYVLRREAKDLGIDFALPPVGLEVSLTNETWRAYCDMRDELVVWLQSSVATAATAAVKVIRLAQITSGFLGGVEDANIGEDACALGLDSDGNVLDSGAGLGGINGSETIKNISGGSVAHAADWCAEKTDDVVDDLSGSLVVPYSVVDDVRKMIEKIGLNKKGYTLEDIEAGKRTAVPGATAAVKLSTPLVLEIGREKLDFAIAWHADLLKKYPDLKLLVWCRFVAELKRYLAEVSKFGHPVGAACGQKVLDGEQSQKAEREFALRLLHPKTAPAGPATVGATQGTGALGLNFTACRTVLDMSYDFSPWKKKQGDSRVNRPGQTGPVSFFYLIAVGPKGQKTIDHHIMMTRLGKANVNDWTTAAWVRALKEE